MKHSFGSAAGRAAVVKIRNDLFVIEFDSKRETDFIRAICKTATPKLCCRPKIVFEDISGK